MFPTCKFHIKNLEMGMNLTYTRESSYFLFYFWNQIHSSCYVIYLLTNYIATYFFFIFIQFATTIKDVNNTWYSGFSTLWLAIFYREVDFYIWICNFEMNGYIWVDNTEDNCIEAMVTTIDYTTFFGWHCHSLQTYWSLY